MAEELDDDRVCKDVVKIEAYLFQDKDLFDENDEVKVNELKDHLKREGRIEKEPLIKLFERVKKIFTAEPNLLELGATISICGDIHGQFFDLIQLFKVSGPLPKENYLFLGDYVDRGSFSMEVITYLFALKVKWPDKVHLLRGNHECRRMTKFFNFKNECMYKYDEEIYDLTMEIFDALPIAALLGDRYFAVHAGLSPDLRYIQDLNKLDRFQEIPRQGTLCDLLWSDPAPEDDEEGGTKWFRYNKRRGISYIYGKSAIKVFLKSNKIQCVIRGHTVESHGYNMHFQKSKRHIPKVITVFSAPDYCDIYKNQAALIKLSKGVIDILTFGSSPHPYYLPNFKDVFSWSIPFITEKVTGMLTAVLENSLESAEIQKGSTSVTVSNPTLCSLKSKIRAVGKMRVILRKMREEKDNITMLKELSQEDKLPLGLITEGHNAIQREIKYYTEKNTDNLRSSTLATAGDEIFSEEEGEVVVKNLELDA